MMVICLDLVGADWFIWIKFQAKKAGPQLKSRIVAEKPVADCAKLIEQLEDQISTIIREERLVWHYCARLL